MGELVQKLKANLDNFKTNDEERKWAGDFSFIVGADCQYGLIDRYILKLPDPDWSKEVALTKAAIQQINSLTPRPRFFIICGDMLDAFPYPGDDYNLRAKQYATLVETLKELAPDIPLVCVCGNHDVGDTPTKETVRVYREQFGEDFFCFWVGGVKCCVLNSQYYKVPQSVPEELEKQNAMLDTLADSQATHLVAFQHIPFFLNTPEEPDDYFNINMPLRVELLEKLRLAGCRYIFTGHYHRNAGGFYKDVEEIVTSAIGGPLGNTPSGFRIVTVTKDKISHEYVPTVSFTEALWKPSQETSKTAKEQVQPNNNN